MLESTLRLFKAVQVEGELNRSVVGSSINRTVKYGYVLDPRIPHTDAMLSTIERTIGLSGEQANAAFHKSWAIVRDTPMEVLVVQQIVHYITTYGFEALGVFDHDTVYIPKEQLEIPDISLETIPLIVVRALTREQILEKILELGSSGVALKKETLEDIMEIVVENAYESSFVAKIKNRELKARLFDYYGLVPSEPEDFLRFVVNKLTSESLLIKNKNLIEKVKVADQKLLDDLMKKAPVNLASIFFRFKPIFLALRKLSANKTVFNRLRKAANTQHVPLAPDYMNSVTAQIKARVLDPDKLMKRANSASVFRNVRLANALMYRINEVGSIVYRVRNGKGYATEFNWPHGVEVRTKQALETVCNAIANSLRTNVEGKTFYIPPFMHYTLPATEKQFTGNFPTGTSVETSDDMIVGIHWTDNDAGRVDLDLSLIGTGVKLGWDASYKSADLRTLFSGDLTSAPKPVGATELFYLQGDVADPKLIMVNYFSGNGDVPCDLLVAKEKITKFERNHMVDPNNMLARGKIDIGPRQNIIGLVAKVKGANRVYFASMSTGNSITSRWDAKTMLARTSLINDVVSRLELRDMLLRAGAVVLDERPEEGDYIDLSPEALDKTTILNLLSA